MDRTELYIKMADCPEIQENWGPSHGDYYYGNDSISEPDFPEYLTDKQFYRVHLLVDFDSEGGWFHLEPEHIDKSRHTWLPRQDQLQEMVKDGNHMHLLAYKFALYFHGNLDPLYQDLGVDNYTVDSDNSMEQMWLAFVMKERYSKTWDGERWRK